MVVLWDVTQCEFAGRYQCFGETYSLHFQGLNVGIYLKSVLQPGRPTSTSTSPRESQISQNVNSFRVLYCLGKYKGHLGPEIAAISDCRSNQETGSFLWIKFKLRNPMA
jgi:hypothetical protein